RIGKTISPISGKQVKKDDVADVVTAVQQLTLGTKVLIIVPFKQHAKRDAREELNILMQKGFVRMYIREVRGEREKLKGDIKRIEELLELDD
ncbi:hypothetical protein ACEV85_23950, partial [Vibrio parahaemolyticus]